MCAETVSGYRFTPKDLRIADRTEGISAFLRTRNGADFIEPTIRSHIGFYDEIIAVFNQCEDETQAILERLADEFAPKIKLFHYMDRVQPLGSKGHAKTPADHPESIVNYSNFALAQTTRKAVVKLDDDHLAIPDRVAKICTEFRENRADPTKMHCFSGLNIARDAKGNFGIPAFERVSGNGDIGYFYADEDVFFHHDPRFERFGRGKLRRIFAGYFYWHLKFMKAGDGFRNYELVENPESRFAKKRVEFEKTRLMTLTETIRQMTPTGMQHISGKTPGKLALNYTRDSAVAAAFKYPDLESALDATSPGWRQMLGL